MPRIPEYTAPETKLTPTTAGIEAFSTAGRRVAGAYREAGAETLRAAKGVAETQVSQAEWPFTLLTLEEAANKGRQTPGGGLFNLRTIGKVNLPRGELVPGDTAPSMMGSDALNPTGPVLTPVDALDKYTKTYRKLIATQDNPNAVNVVTGLSGRDMRVVDVSRDVGGGSEYPPIPPSEFTQSDRPEGSAFGGVPSEPEPAWPDFAGGTSGL